MRYFAILSFHLWICYFFIKEIYFFSCQDSNPLLPGGQGRYLFWSNLPSVLPGLQPTPDGHVYPPGQHSTLQVQGSSYFVQYIFFHIMEFSRSFTNLSKKIYYSIKCSKKMNSTFRRNYSETCVYFWYIRSFIIQKKRAMFACLSV